MSEICTVWAKAQTCPSALAKDVLKTMAPYFDARGEGWAAVPVLAFETGKSERQVQRGLAQLKMVGLLIATDRTEVYMGRVYPVYRMPIDQGPANTRQALRLKYSDDARGDAGVTPSGVGCHGRHPTPDADVTPRGDAGVTQIGKGIPQEKTHRAGAAARAPEGSLFDQAKALWLARDKARVSPGQAAEAWSAATAKVEGGDAAMLRAVGRYLASDEVRRGRVRDFHRWLQDRRYEGWLAEEAPTLPLVIAAPLAVPPDVFAVVAASANSEVAARTWLGKADWIEERRVVLVGVTAARWLRMNVAQQLRDIGVGIEERAA